MPLQNFDTNPNGDTMGMGINTAWGHLLSFIVIITN